jgi:transposase
MRAYSMDLRERVWADCQAGRKTPALAQKYSVSQSWVRKLKHRHKATGSIARRPPSPGHPATLAPHEARVRKLVRDDPDATLDELRQRLGVSVSIGALCNYPQRLKLSFKKSRPGGRAGPTRRGREAPGVARADAGFRPGQAGVHRRDRCQHQDDPSIRTLPTRTAGGRSGSSRALEDDGVRNGASVGRVGGPDGDRRGDERDPFVAYVEQVLTPTLRAGDIVVRDNLASHKRVAAVRAIEGAGCAVLYLPPYSPDFNPIELAFAKVKTRPRAAELRTIERVENFFGSAHDAFTTDECRSYIRHAGYNAATD